MAEFIEGGFLKSQVEAKFSMPVPSLCKPQHFATVFLPVLKSVIKREKSTCLE